jgi:serine/threonine-protein kinase PRP4
MLLILLTLLLILQVGEVMDGRYEVFATHGKGVFSTVLRARDLKTEGGVGEVAIKIIRANETMYKAAQTEKVGSAPSTNNLQ